MRLQFLSDGQELSFWKKGAERYIGQCALYHEKDFKFTLSQMAELLLPKNSNLRNTTTLCLVLVTYTEPMQPVGRALSSKWFANSFVMVVYENILKAQSEFSIHSRTNILFYLRTSQEYVFLLYVVVSSQTCNNFLDHCFSPLRRIS